MTTREMMKELIIECLEDARQILTRWPGSDSEATLAAVMFRARWLHAESKLLKVVCVEVKDQPPEEEVNHEAS